MLNSLWNLLGFIAVCVLAIVAIVLLMLLFSTIMSFIEMIRDTWTEQKKKKNKRA